MASKGRKPASPKVRDLAAGGLHIVGGGSGKPPAPPPADPAPAWIEDPVARKLWGELQPELRRRKLYISLFECELGRYCVAFGQYVAALKAMGKDGPVTLSSKKVPMLSMHQVVANRAHAIMQSLAGDLGLNPVAHVRLDGVQLDMFDQPRPTGTNGPETGGTGFGTLRRQ
jgi:P27 family predicted phage terminase small subunit